MRNLLEAIQTGFLEGQQAQMNKIRIQAGQQQLRQDMQDAPLQHQLLQLKATQAQSSFLAQMKYRDSALNILKEQAQADQEGAKAQAQNKTLLQRMNLLPALQEQQSVQQEAQLTQRLLGAALSAGDTADAQGLMSQLSALNRQGAAVEGRILAEQKDAAHSLGMSVAGLSTQGADAQRAQYPALVARAKALFPSLTLPEGYSPAAWNALSGAVGDAGLMLRQQNLARQTQADNTHARLAEEALALRRNHLGLEVTRFNVMYNNGDKSAVSAYRALPVPRSPAQVKAAIGEIGSATLGDTTLGDMLAKSSPAQQAQVASTVLAQARVAFAQAEKEGAPISSNDAVQQAVDQLSDAGIITPEGHFFGGPSVSARLTPRTRTPKAGTVNLDDYLGGSAPARTTAPKGAAKGKGRVLIKEGDF